MSDYGQLLLNAVKAGWDKKRGEKDQAQEDQRIKLAEKQLADSVKRAEGEFKQRDEHFKISQEALSKQFALRVFEAKQEAIKNLQNDIAVPGVQSAPASEGTGGAMFSPTNPQNATRQMVSFPQELGGGTQEIPSATQSATNQANRKRIIDAPTHEARLAEIEKTRTMIAEQAAANKAADEGRMLLLKAEDEKRELIRQRAETDRDKKHNEVILQIAAMNKASKNDSGVDLGPYARDVIDGNMSLEQVQRLPLKQVEKATILGAVKSAGMSALTKEQMELVNEFPQIIGSIKYMDELITNQPDHKGTAASWLSGAANSMNQALTGPEKELSARSSVVARFLREKGNLSNRDIERVQNMFPTRYNPKSTNIKFRNDFRKELDQLLDAKLASLPPAQRNIIKKRVGVLDVKDYESQQSTVGTKLDPATIEYMKSLGMTIPGGAN
jgi:hypothetical protein